jgi:integrase
MRRRAFARAACQQNSSQPSLTCRVGRTTAAWFQAAVKRAGVQAITSRDLGHTCASPAISAGVNVLALQRMLGHKSAKITLDTYADLFDDDLDAMTVTLHARYSHEVTRKCAQNVPAERSES